MEGLIPFVYRAIVEYKNANRDHNNPNGLIAGCWFSDSPSASYIRLPAGDSGRFQAPDISAFAAADHFGFATSSPPSSSAASGVHSPVRRRSVAA